MYRTHVPQAVEAKEGLPVTAEQRTSSSISYQALFAYYAKLAGMTVGWGWGAAVRQLWRGLVPALHSAQRQLPGGFAQPVAPGNCVTCAARMVPQGTAVTEMMELNESYRLNVVRVPPHRPSARIDRPMRCFYFEKVGWAEHLQQPSVQPGRQRLCLAAGWAVAWWCWCGWALAGAERELSRLPATLPSQTGAFPHQPTRLQPAACPHPSSEPAAFCLSLLAQGRDSAVWGLLRDARERGQPVLIGTGSVEESERLLKVLAPHLRCVPGGGAGMRPAAWSLLPGACGLEPAWSLPAASAAWGGLEPQLPGACLALFGFFGSRRVAVPPCRPCPD